MTLLKTTLMTAAMLALPFSAFAQVPTDKMTDEVKDKAVDTVLDNMTTDDAVTAGKVMIKGGSKEDAALAVAKKRAGDRAEDMMGETAGDMMSKGDLSKDGMMSAAEKMAVEKAEDAVMSKDAGSATTYKDKADHMMEGKAEHMMEGKADQMMEGKVDHMMKDKAEHMMKDKAAGSATTYGDKVMTKAEDMKPAPMDAMVKPAMTEPVMEAPVMAEPAIEAPTVIAVACPTGTTAQPDGTCMMTGDLN